MSLYPLSKDVQEMLRAKRFPLRVHYGPERMHREGYPENVVIFERDRGASDTMTHAVGSQQNARRIGARGLQSIATVYARNSRSGARVEDHEELCEKFVDAILVALRTWAVATRAGIVPITSARYLSFAERLSAAAEHAPGAKAELCEQWPGAVYQIKFTVPRALIDLDYSGAGAPEITLGDPAIASVTAVSGPSGASGTGCGG